MYSGGATGQSSLLSSQFQQGSHNASLSTLFTYHQCFGSESARIRFLPGPNPQKKYRSGSGLKRKRKEWINHNFVEKEMCNANNFISSVQTSGIRIRITGYSFRKALETEKKNTLESFLHQGKKAIYVFLCYSSVSGNLEPKKIL